jgi:hypothetical protein
MLERTQSIDIAHVEGRDDFGEHEAGVRDALGAE